jgi:hypothetical protein
MANNNHNAAIEYASKGWPVLPLHTPIGHGCSCGKADCDKIGKHPRFHPEDLTNGVKNATTDAVVIRRWWARWPNANIGIATGKESFDVLDVDLHPDDGNETLADLEHKHKRLPDTVEQITGSGGRQIMFVASGKISNSVRFAPGLDTRTDGGYIVAPPSLHASGRRYEWEASSMPGDVPLAAMPSWLIRLIREANGAGQQPAGGNGNGWHLPLLRGVSEGARNQTATKLAGLYITKGLKAIEVYLLLTGWDIHNRPPLGKQEIEQTIRSVLNVHARNKKTGERNEAKPRVRVSFG